MELGDEAPDWFQYDNQGMIVPHSILGSLEHFKMFLEAKGNTELLKRIPKSSHPVGILENHESHVVENKTEIPSGRGQLESNALEHMNTRMRLRGRQQDSLSGSLRIPAGNLQMNQANRFRETQEKRDMLNKVVHSGRGHGVGSKFWRLPQRYGDEMSGIAATLTKTERGIREPNAHAGLPSSTQQESGITRGETVRHASRARDQRAYLKQQCQELCEAAQDVDFQKPDIDKLEVIDSGKPFTAVSHSATVENEKKEEDQLKDLAPQSDDVQSEREDLHGPALRVCGQLARWTGNSNTNQDQVGISATISFECLTGEVKSSYLKLHNVGSTAIFYSWQQLELPHNFPHLLPRTKTQHFYLYFDSSGVILPGATQSLKFIFKSERPGIQTELWQLNTHPALLQGASIQVTLRGVALYQDKTKDDRLYIETKVEKIVTQKMCRSIVYEMLQGVHTPERPSSPAELYESEEQEFLLKNHTPERPSSPAEFYESKEQEFQCKNPKFYYINQPVEDFKKLWDKAKPGCSWDLSIDTLRQVLLSLPDDESADDCLTRETGLAQLNSLVKQLCEPLPKLDSPSVATIGALWRKLLWSETLNKLCNEAERLSQILHLSEKDTQKDQKEEAVILEHDVTVSRNEETENKGGAPTKVKKNVLKPKKEPKLATAVKLNEDIQKKEGSRTDHGKHGTDRSGKEANHEHPFDDPAMNERYRRLLHEHVYVLVETLVDSLCVLSDALQDDAADELQHKELMNCVPGI